MGLLLFQWMSGSFLAPTGEALSIASRRRSAVTEYCSVDSTALAGVEAAGVPGVRERAILLTGQAHWPCLGGGIASERFRLG